MLSVSEAQSRLISLLPPPGRIEHVPLVDAEGRVLAQTILASHDLPPFTNSSMDGFALRSADVQSASRESPVELRVIADLPAGRDPRGISIGPGQAVRIMTGAPLPQGADAVVPVEDTDQAERRSITLPSSIRIFRAVAPGESVRPAGMDAHAGETIFAPGRRLRPADVGALAMLGISQVPVYPLPHCAIFSSGDELLPPSLPLTPGKIYESNSVMLQALLRREKARVTFLGILPDRMEEIRDAFERAVQQGVDLILSTAGVSVGAFDWVRKVLEEAGELEFWRVNVRPGKPLLVGCYRQVPFIGLPGNPVSAFVGFELFVRPALARLSGTSWRPRRRYRVFLDEPIESDGRESYLRAIVSEQDGQYRARLSAHQGSGNLLSLVKANALLILPSGVKSLPVGSEVEAWFLDE
jgi:molybdopterin molybdotransferase